MRPSRPAHRKPTPRRPFITRRHLWGIGLGALAGLALEASVPAVRAVAGRSGGLAWGAALGGILASLPEFAAAGAILTRRPNRGLNMRALNVAVGLGIPALLMALVYFLLRLL
jgi:hypothetical protein